jgi:hypothetical protein
VRTVYVIIFASACLSPSLSRSLLWAQNPDSTPTSYCDRLPTAATNLTELAPTLAERRAFICEAMQQKVAEARRTVEWANTNNWQLLLKVSRLAPFADWDFYYVSGDSLLWTPNPGQSYQAVEVPAGFVTDLASIPRAFWQVLKPEGRHAYAAVVHDYLYWTQSRPREEADEIFKFALEDSKVDSKVIGVLYGTVRRLGQRAWDNNAKLKRAGECRMLYNLPPSDLLISWSEWRKKPGAFKDCMPKHPWDIWFQ